MMNIVDKPKGFLQKCLETCEITKMLSCKSK